jgi:hypothetical protein
MEALYPDFDRHALPRDVSHIEARNSIEARNKVRNNPFQELFTYVLV